MLIFNNRSLWSKIFFAILSGLVMALPFLNLDSAWGRHLGWIPFFAMTPLAWELLCSPLPPSRFTRARAAFFLGWMMGVVFFVTTLFWISSVAWEGVILLPPFLALYFGGWSLFVVMVVRPLFFADHKNLFSKLPEAANNCVAPVLASSSIDGTLSRCAPSTPCSLSPSATLKTGSHKQLAVVGQEPDFLIHASMQPNNPLYSQQWYLWKSCSNIEGFWDKRIFFSTIDAFDAWEIQNSAESVVVAVIDTGIRYTHEDLAANMWHENNPMYGTICGWNFSVKDDDPKKNDPMDGLGHGTACAGIIGALGNSGVGIAGIAWKVKLMALKFLNDQGIGSVSNAVSSIDFACEHGAQILNCSWGYVPTSDDPKAINHIFPDQATALQASIKRARDQGVIVVTAAGNEGKDNDQHPEYPANYPLDNIISVASTTEDNQLASFSSYGATTVHLAAPGEEIFSTWARNDHDYITTETREDILNSILNPDKKEDLDFSKQPCGTSFSVPQVVGALALMKERFPTWTYQQLIKRLIDTSDKIPSLEGKMVGGKLNVARALSNPVLPSSTY